MRKALLLLWFACTGEPATVAPKVDARAFHVFELDLAQVELTLLGQRADEPFTFAALAPSLTACGQTRVMATPCS